VSAFDACAADVAAQHEQTVADWRAEVADAFTPGNARFSGSLPLLRTEDENLDRLYAISCLTLLCMKRTRRMGSPARVYATGAPTWTHCFLWDASVTSLVVALLDPAVLRARQPAVPAGDRAGWTGWRVRGRGHRDRSRKPVHPVGAPRRPGMASPHHRS
jgi:hypothetical protein